MEMQIKTTIRNLTLIRMAKKKKVPQNLWEVKKS